VEIRVTGIKDGLTTMPHPQLTRAKLQLLTVDIQQSILKKEAVLKIEAQVGRYTFVWGNSIKPTKPR